MLLAAATIAASLTAPPTATADAEIHGPFGLLCGFTSANDPTIEGSQTGEMDAGPLVLTDLTTGLPDPTATASIHCTLQTGTNDTHAEADAVSVSGSATGALVLTAGTMTYAVGSDEDVYLCTSVTYTHGITLYADAATGAWSQSPSSSCDLAISVESPLGVLDPVVDPVVCPTLAVLFPPEGDIPGFWDCPPYRAFRGPGGNGNGNAYGHNRRYQEPDPDADPVDDPPEPYYPKGTVEITSTALGQVSYNYSSFDPPIGGWSCNEVGTTVTCRPPTAPPGKVNRCGNLEVGVTNYGTGSTTGESRCSTGNSASQSSNGPTTAESNSSGRSEAAFPWVCEGRQPASAAPTWKVRCKVGP